MRCGTQVDPVGEKIAHVVHWILASSAPAWKFLSLSNVVRATILSGGHCEPLRRQHFGDFTKRGAMGKMPHKPQVTMCYHASLGDDGEVSHSRLARTERAPIG